MSLVYPHPFPGGGRRQVQAAEVREEKGQSQIPLRGWKCRRKSQSEDLRRAFSPSSCPAPELPVLGWGGATLTWECEKKNVGFGISFQWSGRFGWQVSAGRGGSCPGPSPTPFYSFFMSQKLQEAAVLEGSTAHPSHTARVTEPGPGSPVMVLGGFQISQPLLQHSRKGWLSARYSRRAVLTRELINDAASASHLSSFPPEVQCSPSACGASDWRCQPGVAAPLPPADLLFS